MTDFNKLIEEAIETRKRKRAEKEEAAYALTEKLRKQQRDQARQYVRGKLAKDIRAAVAKEEKTLFLFEVGMASSVDSLEGYAAALVEEMRLIGLRDRLEISFDNTGENAIRNHLMLRLEKT